MHLAVERGTGLTATLSKFSGRGGAGKQKRESYSGFTLTKFKFQSSRREKKNKEARAGEVVTTRTEQTSDAPAMVEHAL